MGMVQMPKTDSQKMLGARTKIVSHKAQKPILQEKNEMMKFYPSSEGCREDAVSDENIHIKLMKEEKKPNFK